MSAATAIRLSELSARIQGVLDRAFSGHHFWVIADITNHQFREQKNYHNFELVEKDPDSDGFLAKFAAKAWGKGAQQVRQFEQITGQRFTNHIQVLMLVSVEFHEVYGLSLNLMDVDPNYTVGKLFEQRELTLARLVRENDFIQRLEHGYWTRNKSLQLPAVIQQIAIISSLNSAGMEDFKHCLKSNPRGYRFFIDEYLTVVQGESNAPQLVDRLIAVFQSGKPYDVVVIIRGGGAQTDFLLFDNYRISQAVAKFPIPVITGIGHQKNETIADLMAHTATKTPTQAAEFIIDHNRVFEQRLIGLQRKILVRTQQLLARQSQSLHAMNTVVTSRSSTLLQHQRISLLTLRQDIQQAASGTILRQGIGLQKKSTTVTTRAKQQISEKRNDLGVRSTQLRTWAEISLKARAAELKNYQSLIRVMSPLNILKKGFAIVKMEGKIQCRPDLIRPGSSIDVILADTIISSTVQQKTTYHGTDFDV